MKTNKQNNPISSLLTPIFLILIGILILRPRVLTQENIIKEKYSCKVSQKIENPKYKLEQEKWINGCLKSKTGILKQAACQAESINIKYTEPMIIQNIVEDECERPASIQKQYILKLYALDPINIKLYSTSQKIDYSSSETDSSEASNLIMSDPKVKEFFELSPNPHLSIDNVEKNESFWNIHVYEDLPDHTVTFNWYEVDKQTGEVKERINTGTSK